MPRATAYDERVHAAIVSTLRVGASRTSACRSAGVSRDTFNDWIQRGRRWNSGDHTDPRDAHYALFAEQCDNAHDLYLTSLRARVVKGTEKRPKFAFEVLRWEENRLQRREEKRLLKAKANVEEQRAAGLLVERHEVKHVSEMTEDELRTEALRLLAVANGSGEHKRATG